MVSPCVSSTEQRAQRNTHCTARSRLLRSRSEVVRLAIRLDQRELALLSRQRLPVLHPEESRVPAVVDELEHVAVVHLARTRLLPSRRVPRLDVRDLVEAPIEVVDQVPLVD